MTKKNTLNKKQEKRINKIVNRTYKVHVKWGWITEDKYGQLIYFRNPERIKDLMWRVIYQVLPKELAEQKKEIIEKLEKMKMPISQADKDLAKGTEESGIFRVFLNEAINQAIRTIKEMGR